MKIALIDSDEDFCLLLGQFLSIDYPAAEISERDPAEARKNPRSLQDEDILFIDSGLADLITDNHRQPIPRPCIAIVRDPLLKPAMRHANFELFFADTPMGETRRARGRSVRDPACRIPGARSRNRFRLYERRTGGRRHGTART